MPPHNGAQSQLANRAPQSRAAAWCPATSGGGERRPGRSWEKSEVLVTVTKFTELFQLPSTKSLLQWVGMRRDEVSLHFELRTKKSALPSSYDGQTRLAVLGPILSLSKILQFSSNKEKCESI